VSYTRIGICRILFFELYTRCMGVNFVCEERARRFAKSCRNSDAANAARLQIGDDFDVGDPLVQETPPKDTASSKRGGTFAWVECDEGEDFDLDNGPG